MYIACCIKNIFLYLKKKYFHFAFLIPFFSLSFYFSFSVFVQLVPVACSMIVFSFASTSSNRSLRPSLLSYSCQFRGCVCVRVCVVASIVVIVIVVVVYSSVLQSRKITRNTKRLLLLLLLLLPWNSLICVCPISTSLAQRPRPLLLHVGCVQLQKEEKEKERER